MRPSPWLLAPILSARLGREAEMQADSLQPATGYTPDLSRSTDTMSVLGWGPLSPLADLDC